MARRKPILKKTPSKTKKSRSKKAPPTTADWPVTRNVMFRPERLEYVRKIVRSEGCVFCSARQAGVQKESLVVATHGTAMLVINKFPYNAGHLLALPMRHVGAFEDLTVDENADIQALLKKAVHALKELYSPAGFNMGLNLGAAAGAGIPDHLHWHLIPRWPGDANFFPLIAETKVVIETLERTYERLVPYFS